MRWKLKCSRRDVSHFRHIPFVRSNGGFCLPSQISLNRRTVTPSNSVNYSSNTRGKEDLKFIAHTADILPDVPNCRRCLAFKFIYESVNICCCNGRVSLVSNQLPLIMQHLLTADSEEAKHFRLYMRTYNNHFAFTSFGVHADTLLSQRNQGIYTFRVQGQVYHFINELDPINKSSDNLQLYFHDCSNEVRNRVSYCSRLSEKVVKMCIKYLEANPYAIFFRSLSNVQNLNEYKIVFKTVPSQDQRVYNKPTVSQVATVLVEGQEYGESGSRNIQVKTHEDDPRNINFFYGCYDPLQYPLTIPYGELGWHQNIPKQSPSADGSQHSNVSSSEVLLAPSQETFVDNLLSNEATDNQTMFLLESIMHTSCKFDLLISPLCFALEGSFNNMLLICTLSWKHNV